MKTPNLILGLIVTAGLGACTPATRLAAPSGFVVLDDDGPYDYRATTAEGVVLAVRRLPNDPRGDLGFWSAAVDARLRRQYTAETMEDVETTSGLAGRQIRYRADRGGRPYLYWATVFVKGDRVFLVEAGGDEAFFTAQEDAIQDAILAFEG